METNNSQFTAKTKIYATVSAFLLVGAASVIGTTRFVGNVQRGTETLHQSAEPEAVPVAVAKGEDTDSGSELPLAERSVKFTVDAGDTGPNSTGTILVSKFPKWVEEYRTLIGATGTRISRAAVQEAIEGGAILGLELKQDAMVLSTDTDKKKVTRAKTDVVARSGYVFDVEDVSLQIANALMDSDSEVIIKAEFKKPIITMQNENGSFETLELLSTAYSDFSDSTPGRLHNVYKAIQERLNNVVVRQGAIYSHVDMLDAPITNEKGWMDDKGLFGGGVALTPGAGICQSSTTLYRGVLLAGLPIVKARAHSLFVDHYEFYGIGLDATVFPGVQDLQFKNDTDGDIVIQAYITDETSKVTLQIFGKHTGRRVTMEGPYFAGSKNRPARVPALSSHQIAWVRKIEWPDGHVTEENRLSTYAKPVWNYIVKKYIGTNGMELLVTKGK